VRIQTDDPETPFIEVAVAGTVEALAEIEPNQISFMGHAQDLSAVEVVIVPNPKYPFRIEGVTAQNGDNIKFELKERCSDGQGRCVLKVENKRTEKGRYSDSLLVRTDHPMVQEIPIRVVGRIF
jgi:hypothetical protein